MGGARIWFTPSADQGSRTIEIGMGAPFTDRDGPRPVMFKSSTESQTGARVITWQGGRNRQTFRRVWDSRANGDGRLIRRKLWALVNHLGRGGTCSVAEDVDYAYAAFAANVPGFGDTRVHVTKNKFYPTIPGSLNTDIANRECMIQSDCDAYLTEMSLVSSTSLNSSGGTITLNGPLRFDYGNEARWVLLRDYGSYICQRLPDDVDPSTILTHDHENNWTLELPLEDDPGALDSLASSDTDGDGGPVVLEIDTFGGINPTYQEAGSVLKDLQGIQVPATGGWYVP